MITCQYSFFPMPYHYFIFIPKRSIGSYSHLHYMEIKSSLANSSRERCCKRKKETVKLEDIAIATPKKDEMEPEILKGRVEHFNEAKGYGFIKDLVSAEKYFFHVSSAPAGIAEGNTVTFETEKSARGMNAVSITLTK